MWTLFQGRTECPEQFGTGVDGEVEGRRVTMRYMVGVVGER